MSAALILQQQQLAAAIRNDCAPESGLLQTTPQGLAARLHIYGEAYRARLGAALKENYPVLALILGDDGFAELANAFLQAHPSQTASIRWFGTRLAEFTKHNPELVPHPALTDLIRMEWALNTAFDAADAAVLQVDALLSLAPELWPGLTFTAQPCVQLLTLDWNVEPLWSALSADENAETEPPEPLVHHLLIWRIDQGDRQRNQWRSVQPDEAALLHAALAGDNFAALCEIAGAVAGPNAAASVAGYLRHWVESGLLAGFRS